MRMTVAELIDELRRCDPKADVHFQTGIGDAGPVLLKHVLRVDNLGVTTRIVVEKGF